MKIWHFLNTAVEIFVGVAVLWVGRAPDFIVKMEAIHIGRVVCRRRGKHCSLLVMYEFCSKMLFTQ